MLLSWYRVVAEMVRAVPRVLTVTMQAGCGHGLLGMLALKRGAAHVDFSDFVGRLSSRTTACWVLMARDADDADNADDADDAEGRMLKCWSN